jgi:hypothetical protein
MYRKVNPNPQTAAAATKCHVVTKQGRHYALSYTLTAWFEGRYARVSRERRGGVDGLLVTRAFVGPM